MNQALVRDVEVFQGLDGTWEASVVVGDVTHYGYSLESAVDAVICALQRSKRPAAELDTEPESDEDPLARTEPRRYDDDCGGR